MVPESRYKVEGRLPTRGPEFRDVDGNILSVIAEAPNGRLLRTPISALIEDAGLDIEDWR